MNFERASPATVTRTWAQRSARPWRPIGFLMLEERARRVQDQTGGGWKMEGFCPEGRAAGSSTVRFGGETLGIVTRVAK